MFLSRSNDAALDSVDESSDTAFPSLQFFLLDVSFHHLLLELLVLSPQLTVFLFPPVDAEPLLLELLHLTFEFLLKFLHFCLEEVGELLLHCFDLGMRGGVRHFL
jgi:hypothetical protein